MKFTENLYPINRPQLEELLYEKLNKLSEEELCDLYVRVSPKRVITYSDARNLFFIGPESE